MATLLFKQQRMALGEARYNLRLSKNSHAVLFGTLAQLVEQRTFNPLVAGSNPARPTKKFKDLAEKPSPFSLADAAQRDA